MALNTQKDTSKISNNDFSKLIDSTFKDNLRYEISSVNYKRGLFTLLIRKGDDTSDTKKILETWNNISLDPNDNSYIAKVIGDQVLTLRGSGTSDPYLQLSGSYPNKSKYVRVSTVQETVDYLDENGSVRVNAASSSLPHSGSGSFNGGFTAGADGFSGFDALGNHQGTKTGVQPANFYEEIGKNNTQGFDPTGERPSR